MTSSKWLVWLCLMSGVGFVTACTEFTVTPKIPPYAGVWKPLAAFNYGDSITRCAGVTDSANCYPNRIAKYLSLSETTNRATSGDQACDVGKRQVFPTDSPDFVAIQPLRTLMIGTNDAWFKGAGKYEATFNLCHRAVISWLGTPLRDKVMGSEAVDSATGDCTLDNTYDAAEGIVCASSGSAAGFTIVTTGSPIYIWYRILDGDSGVFSYTVDGGAPVKLLTQISAAPVSTLNGSTDSVALERVPVKAGTHRVQFIQLTPGHMAITALGTMNQIANAPLPYLLVADLPDELHNHRGSAVRAYRSDSIRNIEMLEGDGLDIVHAPVGESLAAVSTDMYDQLHPNDLGHIEMLGAFTFAVQQLPGGAAH